MKVKNRIGPHGKVNINDSGAINILEEDCVAELPDISVFPWRIFLFWPLNGSKVTITCHGSDLIDGHREIVIHEDKIHAILGMEDRYHADFKVVPVTPEVVASAETVQEVLQTETAA